MKRSAGIAGEDIRGIDEYEIELQMSIMLKFTYYRHHGMSIKFNNILGLPFQGKNVLSDLKKFKNRCIQTLAYLALYEIWPKCMYVMYILGYPVSSIPEIYKQLSAISNPHIIKIKQGILVLLVGFTAFHIPNLRLTRCMLNLFK
jgi:hypothetical protein